MILLLNGGTSIAVLRREDGRWRVAHKGLRGCSISAVTASPRGTLFAASHGVGVARSRDGGMTWEWPTRGSNTTICGRRAAAAARFAAVSQPEAARAARR